MQFGIHRIAQTELALNPIRTPKCKQANGPLFALEQRDQICRRLIHNFPNKFSFHLIKH